MTLEKRNKEMFRPRRDVEDAFGIGSTEVEEGK